MRGIANLSRRRFLKSTLAAGGCLLLGLAMPNTRGRAYAAAPPEAAYTPSAFLRIGPDNTVTMIINKSEMGQGVYTSLPMLIAEELECDWNTVRVEPSPVAPIYNHTVFGTMVTGGSTSVATEWERMRKAGAAAREMLIRAAAETWKVDRKTCRAENGAIYHRSGKKLTFGQLAAKAAAYPVPKQVTLKDPSAFKIIGKPTRRLDSQEKVNGKGIFGIDAALPGMLIAVMAHPPVFRGKVRSVNDEKARAVPGVKAVVQTDSGGRRRSGQFLVREKGKGPPRYHMGRWRARVPHHAGDPRGVPGSCKNARRGGQKGRRPGKGLRRTRHGAYRRI